jgi:hypothetical protein
MVYIRQRSPTPSEKMRLKHTGVACGTVLVGGLVLVAVSPTSIIAKVLVVAGLGAFFAWFIWAEIVFMRWVAPKRPPPERLATGRRFTPRQIAVLVLASIPVSLGLPSLLIGAETHTHALIVVGLVLLGAELVVSGLIVPVLRVRLSRRR